MKKILILLLSIFCISCSAQENQKALLKLTSPLHYKPVSIPVYFDSLSNHYSTSLFQIDSAEFFLFCTENNINSSDAQNRNSWVRIMLLHRLFTSSTAVNGSVGPILKIPYFWHWVSPNPRHSIVRVGSGKLLSVEPTIPEFKNYKSYADIDRSPTLFLREMFSTKPLYSHPTCDSFSTFGWCSEREAAFACLMEIYGYSSRVIVSGNHSWSEHLVYLTDNEGEKKCTEVKSDNTFDIVTWTAVQAPVQSAWYLQTGDKVAAQWHNKYAHSETEKKNIRSFVVPEKAYKEIESAVRKFIEGSQY